MPQVRHNRVRRALVCTGLGALLGVASLTLSQCTQVGDSLTGVSRLSNKRVSCKQACENTFIAQHRIENKLHQENMKQCGTADSDQGSACRAAEIARHQAAIDALEAQKSACKATCHTQGGGSAG